MNWNGFVFLGFRYVKRNGAKVVLLIAAFTLVWLLPHVCLPVACFVCVFGFQACEAICLKHACI